MDRKCLICGHTNRETATFCESCGNRLSAITKRTFTRPSEPSYVESLKELGRSAGWGLGLIPISVIVGAVTGAVVAFVGAYLIHGIEWIRHVTGDSNLLVYVFGLIIGSIWLLPLATIYAIVGGVIGAIMGVITGGAGLLILVLTTWLPQNVRFFLIIAAMTVIGILGSNIGLQQTVDVDRLSNATRIWVTLGGAVFGLISGLYASTVLLYDNG
jgi:hypothetical protein